jgi:hypothetical protein
LSICIFVITKKDIMSKQNAREYALDQLQQGKITAGQANVLMVQIEGVRAVRNRLPREVRKALNDAVKSGELGHMKKDGFRPEVFFHKNGRVKAIELRNREHYASIEKLKGAFA